MFLRQCFRDKDGKRHAYWALAESCRTDAEPRQRVVAWLGKLDEAGRLGVEQAARYPPNWSLILIASDGKPVVDACDREEVRLRVFRSHRS